MNKWDGNSDCIWWYPNWRAATGCTWVNRSPLIVQYIEGRLPTFYLMDDHQGACTVINSSVMWLNHMITRQ